MRPDRPYIIQDPVPAGHASMAWGTGASVVLHGFLAILLLFVAHATRLPAVPDDSVPVELINLPPPEPPVPAAPARPAAPAMVTASHLFSDTALADPADRAARREFARLTGDERLQQLCNLEALSQLKAWNAAL
ncbi:MAG: hypothetical protein J0H63_04475, partial [Rhizobiales bacterium]|nr:hypothetical protein [Hyphomicrobiales bacterium]